MSQPTRRGVLYIVDDRACLEGVASWVLDTTCQVGEWLISHCGSSQPPSAGSLAVLA
jgi:hypothetical protein